MRTKNKIILETFPIKSPSPDKRNQNRILNTSIQANTIKRYLQSIKNINQNETVQSEQHSFQQSPHSYYFNKAQASSQSRNQEMLRKRIMELEIQNNQFRQISKEFEDLSNKNKELEQKMLMLLSELEYSQSHPRTQTKSFSYNDKTQKIDGYSTIENIRIQQLKQQTIKHTYPISQFEEQLTESPFDHLRLQTHRKNHKESLERQQQMKRLIDTQIHMTLDNFQSVFIKLVRLLDSQLNQLKSSTQQIQKKLPILLSSSSQGNIEVSKVQYQNLSYKINKPNRQSSLDSNKKDSKVEIQMQKNQSSQRSFGYIHQSRLVTQRKQLHLNDQEQKRDNSMHQSVKHQSNRTDQIVKKVIQSIDTIGTNLAIILSEQNRIKQTTTTFQFQNKIFQKLMDIISTYFPHKKMHTSSLICQENLRQSLLLRQKIKITDSEKFNQADPKEQQESCSRLLKVEVQIINNLQLPSSTRDISSLEFEQTKRKLLQIIEIMKSINLEYRRTLRQKLSEKQKEQQVVIPNRFF